MKPFFLTLISLSLAGGVHAQQNGSPFYLRLGAGYAFSAAGQSEFSYTAASNGSIYTFESGPASFSAGVQATLAGGYRINRHLAAELGIVAVVAPRSYEHVIRQGSNPGITSTTKWKASLPLFLTPSLRVGTGGEKLDIYSRVGVAVPLRSKLQAEMTEVSSGGSIGDFYSKTEYRNRTRLGIAYGLGASWSFNKHVSVYGELNGLSMNVWAKKSEIKKARVGTMDVLNTIPTYGRETEYEFDFEGQLGIVPDYTQPRKTATFSLPFSNIGLGVGVNYSL